MRLLTKLDGQLAKCEFHNDPVVIRVNKFNEESAKKFSEDMNRAHQSGQDVVPILIDSYGGIVDSLVSMISDIKNADLKVATVVTSKAMSCGAVLFTCGAEGYRFMDPRARLMIHDVSSGVHGKVKDLEVKAEETTRLDEFIYLVMAQNCGKPDTYFKDKVHELGHADWYLTGEQALEHNLANHLRVPRLLREVEVKVTFG